MEPLDYTAFGDYQDARQKFPIDDQTNLNEAIGLLCKQLCEKPIARAHGLLSYAYMTQWLERWDKPPFPPQSGWTTDQLIEAARYHAQRAVTMGGSDFDTRWALGSYYLCAAKTKDATNNDQQMYYKLARKEFRESEHGGHGGGKAYLAEYALALLHLGGQGDMTRIMTMLSGATGKADWKRWVKAEAHFVRAGRPGQGIAPATDYDEARVVAESILTDATNATLPGNLTDVWLLKAMCHIRLGQPGPAKAALEAFKEQFERIRGVGASAWSLQDEWRSVNFAQPGDLKHWMDALREVRDLDVDTRAWLPLTHGGGGDAAFLGFLDSLTSTFDVDTSWPDPAP